MWEQISGMFDTMKYLFDCDLGALNVFLLWFMKFCGEFCDGMEEMCYMYHSISAATCIKN
jgi:hypothetical protein